MLIFTTIGFFSVAEHPEHEHFVVIDAASKCDLETLAGRIASVRQGYGSKIVHQAKHAFPWRMALPKPLWKDLLASLSFTANYPDFLERVGLAEDLERDIAYYDVLQRMAEYGRAIRKAAGDAQRDTL